MIDIARLALLVRFDIADTCRCLGLRSAARVAANAETPDAWRDVQGDLASLVTDHGREPSRIAAVEASKLMARGRADYASVEMRRFRDEHMTPEQYAAEVAAEAAAAGVSL